MSISAVNQVKLCQILGVTPTELTYQIGWLGTNLTTTIQTGITDQIDLWDGGAGVKTTALYPTESNKGVKTNPDSARNQIRQNIAVLLERPDWGSGSGNYLPRG